MTTPPPTPADPSRALPFPRIDIVLNDGRPRLIIAGTEHPLTRQDLVDMREQARKRIAQTATALGRPVRVTATPTAPSRAASSPLRRGASATRRQSATASGLD